MSYCNLHGSTKPCGACSRSQAHSIDNLISEMNGYRRKLQEADVKRANQT